MDSILFILSENLNLTLDLRLTDGAGVAPIIENLLLLTDDTNVLLVDDTNIKLMEA